MLPRFDAVRYVHPLREGGSLPAVIETDEGGLFVVKFRGAGQGAKVLVAELIVGGLAAHLGLPVPEVALVDVSPRFGRSEPDPEIQELLRRSHGVNIGMRYLEGAFNFEPSAAGELIDAELAARIVWLDAYTTNPDRTHRNPNLMIQDRRPWLIDHGAALYAHHDWAGASEERTRGAFPLIKSHVLLGAAGDIAAADGGAAAALTPDVLRDVVEAVPDELLMDPVAGTGDFPSAGAARARYVEYLATRLASPRAFVAEAIAAQEKHRREPPQSFKARR